jgi:RNA polymerase sigma factor (sigma-70 family)
MSDQQTKTMTARIEGVYEAGRHPPVEGGVSLLGRSGGPTTRLRRRSRKPSAETTFAHRTVGFGGPPFGSQQETWPDAREEAHGFADVAYQLPDETAELILALPRLSPKQRAAIVLHYHSGYSLREVAEIIGSTPSAVGVHLYRGRKRLRELLGDDDA